MTPRQSRAEARFIDVSGSPPSRGCRPGKAALKRGPGRHLPRLAWRIRRFFFATWRSLRTFFLSLYGFSPSLNTKRTGVPTSLKRLRKKFTRQRRKVSERVFRRVPWKMNGGGIISAERHVGKRWV